MKFVIVARLDLEGCRTVTSNGLSDPAIVLEAFNEQDARIAAMALHESDKFARIEVISAVEGVVEIFEKAEIRPS